MLTLMYTAFYLKYNLEFYNYFNVYNIILFSCSEKITNFIISWSDLLNMAFQIWAEIIYIYITTHVKHIYITALGEIYSYYWQECSYVLMYCVINNQIYFIDLTFLLFKYVLIQLWCIKLLYSINNTNVIINILKLKYLKKLKPRVYYTYINRQLLWFITHPSILLYSSRYFKFFSLTHIPNIAACVLF